MGKKDEYRFNLRFDERQRLRWIFRLADTM